MEKKCTKCLTVKKIDDFYKTSRKGGVFSECKECTKKRVRLHREQNIDRIRAYDRERTTPERLERNRAYAKANPEKMAEAKARWIKNNAHKREAHNKVSSALRSGKMVKPSSCQRCNSVAHLESHHQDYSKPLDVMWLCDQCHKMIHKEERASTRAAMLAPSPFDRKFKLPIDTMIDMS